MIVIEKTSRDDLVTAVQFFNFLLDRGNIETIIESKKSFDYTNRTPAQIARFLTDAKNKNDFNPEIIIKKFAIWTSSTARTWTGNYSLIEINSRKIGRSIPSLVNTVCHEYLHCFEFYTKKHLDQDAFFNHGDNYAAGKQDSLQYWVGDQIEVLASEKFGR